MVIRIMPWTRAIVAGRSWQAERFGHAAADRSRFGARCPISDMFHEVVEGSESTDGAGSGGETIEAASLLAGFETLLAEAVADAGPDRVTAATPLDAETVVTVADGDAAGLTVTEGAAVLAATGSDDPETLVAELRDHLLMGMTTAVLDVDTIAAAIDADLTGQEVQQTLEGRAAMTLGQLAEIMAVIETNKR